MPVERSALLQRLGQRLADRGAAAVAAALEHLLEHNEWARRKLAGHPGRILLVRVETPPVMAAGPVALRLRIADGGHLEAADDDPAAPAVTMTLQPSVAALSDLTRDGTSALYRHLQIEGDAMLATELGELARHLRWDPAEDLSRLTGDIAARRIVGGLGAAAGLLRDAAARAGANATHYLSAESGQLVERAALDAFGEDLDRLERRVDALRTASLRTASPWRQ